MKLTKAIIYAAAALILQGCFTGVDSTPKIKPSEVRRSLPAPKAEDSYLGGLNEQPPSQWEVGKRFLVADRRIGLAMGLPGSQSRIVRGDTIRYVGHETIVPVTGGQVEVLIFRGPANTELRYRTSLEPRQFDRATAVSLPYAIDLDLVEQVRRQMQDKDYYLMTSAAYDLAGQPLKTRRFIPVRVDSVRPGNEYYPLQLLLTDSDHKRLMLYMSADNQQGKMPRRFSNLFSLTDPRLNHPNITDANWKLITNGRVAEGMTREEVLLAVGQPDNIDRQPGYSYMREIWTFENGIYLIFEDGLLRAFRQ